MSDTLWAEWDSRLHILCLLPVNHIKSHDFELLEQLYTIPKTAHIILNIAKPRTLEVYVNIVLLPNSLVFWIMARAKAKNRWHINPTFSVPRKDALNALHVTEKQQTAQWLMAWSLEPDCPPGFLSCSTVHLLAIRLDFHKPVSACGK